MATRLKLFAGILVLICVIQLVQMAPEVRYQRDAPADESGNDSVYQKAKEELGKIINEENAKKLIDAASNVFAELGKNLETQFKQFQENMANQQQKQ